ncbi:MAG: amidohydrolase [Phycisphaerae bacterium]|nr:amidohydrolase [Phycisphaerae bacterium]
MSALQLMKSSAAVLILAGITWAQPELPKKPSADLVIVNARVWTGIAGDAQAGEQQPSAIAISGGRIVAVGRDDDVRSFISKITRVIDAGGKRVIPGITDSHTHIVGGGFQLGRLELREVKEKKSFIEAVAAAAKELPRGQWVQGGRWSVESWTKREQPTRYWLDPVTGETPVFLSRMDGHQALANSAALRIAGINADGPRDPVGGEIERDPVTREPTGILKESAMDLVSQHIPPPSSRERAEALRRAMRHANAHGITSVHDMSDPADVPVFADLAARNDLTVRITSYIQWEDWLEHVDEVAALAKQYTGPVFRVAGLKGYMDGSLGSRTAYMREPYADAPSATPYPRGQLTAFAVDREQLLHSAEAVNKRGLQMAVHAIGDEANHRILDVYERCGPPSGGSAIGHRVEHAQHLLLEDIPRFSRLGVVASMQPYHKADDGRYAEDRLGKERLRGSYAYRQLLDAGALLCFGSDWPVVTLDPFAGMDSAVNARTLDGKVWLEDHSIDVEKALRAYTVSPPKAIHRAKELGTIEPGKLADLVILDRDILTIPPENISGTKPFLTIMNGRIVYERSK